MIPHPSLFFSLFLSPSVILPDGHFSIIFAHCLFCFLSLCYAFGCLSVLVCVCLFLHVLGRVWQHWEVTKEVNDDRPSIMLYGLCMVLPWRVAALCSNSEHPVPPYNLAGALPLASPLLTERLCVCDAGGMFADSLFKVRGCEFIWGNVTGLVHIDRVWVMSFHYGMMCHCWEHQFRVATTALFVCEWDTYTNTDKHKRYWETERLFV